MALFVMCMCAPGGLEMPVISLLLDWANQGKYLRANHSGSVTYDQCKPITSGKHWLSTTASSLLPLTMALEDIGYLSKSIVWSNQISAKHSQQ